MIFSPQKIPYGLVLDVHKRFLACQLPIGNGDVNALAAWQPIWSLPKTPTHRAPPLRSSHKQLRQSTKLPLHVVRRAAVSLRQDVFLLLGQRLGFVAGRGPVTRGETRVAWVTKPSVAGFFREFFFVRIAFACPLEM